MIVIDASVAIKLLHYDEDGAEIARELYKNHTQGAEKIIVPDFIYIETANALATKNVLTNKEISEGINFLFGSGFVSYSVTLEDIKEAALLAKRHGTSIYDMLYAVIAKNKKIKLITADTKFAKKTGFPYVKTLSETTVAPRPSPK